MEFARYVVFPFPRNKEMKQSKDLRMMPLIKVLCVSPCLSPGAIFADYSEIHLYSANTLGHSTAEVGGKYA